MNPPRISKMNGITMIIVAAFFDVLQFLLTLIPFVGWMLSPIVTFIAAVTFGIWCSHVGMSLLDSKRSLGYLGTMLGEFIPIIDALPFWTCLIVYTVLAEWRRKDGI